MLWIKWIKHDVIDQSSADALMSWWRRFVRLIRLTSPKNTQFSPTPYPSSLTWPRTFQENDSAIIHLPGRRNGEDKLIKALTVDGTYITHKGAIQHADIIGKRPRDRVSTSSGVSVDLRDATLADYVRLTKRLVTPIYPTDASVIVSLLDIHLSPCSSDGSGGSKFEILEAGTGHGALTLHLSRAIHPGNLPRVEGQSEEDWQQRRSAVLHTVEISEKYSRHARKIVNGFRQGIYAGNVDFHVGSVGDFVRDRFRERRKDRPFLAHALLDLPSVEQYLDVVSQALHSAGKLIVFAPSITQIIKCFELARSRRLPLVLDKTLELGNNGSSGGREWSLKAVIPREKLRLAQVVDGSSPAEIIEHNAIQEIDGSDSGAIKEGLQALEREAPAESDDITKDTSSTSGEDEYVMVCRPRVGDVTAGGGFLAVFVKKGDHE